MKKTSIDSFVSDDLLQNHIDEITQFEERHKRDNLDRDLYYFPYNDIYYKYKDTINKTLCKKEKDVRYKYEQLRTEYELMEDKYQDLRRKISPEFNPVFGDIVQLNKYESGPNDKVTYLKVKRHNTIDDINDPSRAYFQLYLNKEGNKCLEQTNNGLYNIADCSDINISEKTQQELTNDNKKQLFNLDYVYDKSSYEEVVKNPDFRYPEKPELLNYPITLLRANNGNCINLHNDGTNDNISIEPCKYKKSQMFKITPI